jgi:hypothetical protein
VKNLLSRHGTARQVSSDMKPASPQRRRVISPGRLRRPQPEITNYVVAVDAWSWGLRV